MGEARPRTYTSGEICEKFGIAKNTLFRWEREGKIPTPERDWRNHRRYTEEHVRAIKALMEGEFRYIRERISRWMMDEGNPRARQELEACHQLNSVFKFTKHGDEFGLYELQDRETLASETIRELLQEAQRQDPRSEMFRKIIELVHSKVVLSDKGKA